jgi:D-ribose pyranase
LKRNGILNPSLNRILAETGHTDMLTICDRGFPVPLSCERLDLSLVDGLPSVLDVLRAIHRDFIIDTVLVTDEMIQASPDRYEQLVTEFAELKFRAVSHQRFKEICPESRAVIRTGDIVPYANVIIISG